MGDRQDIDALLMGALYGELDAAEQARLEAHLASHPADRAAMESLSETRSRVRDSIAIMPQLDPAPAISTLLLREAARRAPRPREGVLGWLSSLFQPVVRHPALAGAMALLLVGGTATLLYKNGKVDSRPEPTTDYWNEAPVGGRPAADSFGGQPNVSNDVSKDLSNVDHGGAIGGSVAGSGSAAGSAAGSGSADSYQVQLADQEAQRQQVAADKPDPSGSSGGDGTLAKGKVAANAPRREAPTTPSAKAPAKTRAGYLEVAPDDRQPKQLDGLAIADGPGGAPSAAGGAGGGASATAGAAPGRPATTENAISSADAAAPAPKAAQAASGAYDQGEDAKTTEWAQLQHQRLAQLVKAGNCVEAGKLGGEIAARAPEYYAAHVENDRAVRGCKQYIDHDKRKKADEAAKSRSRSVQPDLEAEPAPAMH